ncbi:hypothetical protein [Chryseobacterium pennipullorum]|uniref:Outer membrane protein beta-barrel domain-containing protein n=1 Tax=Chryseobacterium pennipullorum TaxID=2258963 RepID=A0A3D9B7F3_9FLAO|nr:hypothetical protein [Chryseobacterium pennipullorum]REC49453.1 hypothetical protein DRF67_02950 [Chryseobacterium pennipullorum]
MNKNILSVLLFILTDHAVKSQTVNWAALQAKERHILNANIGAEYGAVFGIGYGYQFNTGWFPVIVGADLSTPLGETLLDDFKVKAGANVRWFRIRDIQFSTRVQGLFRRFENDNVAIGSFGLDMAGVIGYYKPRWYGAAEVGFDKAIVSHFQHTEHYQDIFPDVKNGWYEPSTGGNFYYGIQTGYSFPRQEIYLKLGKVISQDFKTKPHLPFMVQIGYNYKL